MNTERLAWVCVAEVLLLAGPVSADFVGLGATLRAFTSTGGMTYDTYELYATFDSDTDGAFAVHGVPDAPQTLESGPGGFFKTEIFGVEVFHPLNSGVIEGIPDYAGDSMLTIGVRQGYTGTPTIVTVDGFNGAAFLDSSTVVTTTNGGWFVDAADPVTAALPFPPPPWSGDQVAFGSGSFGVIIGQFTVAQGNTFSGDLGQLSIYENGVERIIDNTNGALFSFAIPGPGGMALLGIAMCASRRRRRVRGDADEDR